MKTYYLLYNANKLLTQLVAIQLFENIDDLKEALALLTTTSPYWTIYKIQREALSQGQVININPREDEAAIFHIFQSGWETFFQPIEQFPVERRASLILRQAPPIAHENILYHRLGLTLKSCTIEQKIYIKELEGFLSPHFFKKSYSDQWEELFTLRLKKNFFVFLYQHPEPSRTLLENMALAAGEAAQQALKQSTTLAPLFDKTMLATQSDAEASESMAHRSSFAKAQLN